MIFASPKNKGFVMRPAAPDTEAPSPVEQMLYQSDDWKPHCPPPADFAAFTRRALKNSRAPFPPPNSRPASSVQWVRGLRAPLAASLALGLVLGVGGSVNDLNDGLVPGPTREAVHSVLGETPNAPIHTSQTPEQSSPLARTAEKAHPAARPAANDTVQASRLPYALISHRATTRRRKPRGTSRDVGASRAENLLAARSAKPTPPAPLWKTETVERPAWGALIPATFACTTPANEMGSGSAGDETETTLMPVVLDVALPETTNLAAATGPSSTTP